MDNKEIEEKVGKSIREIIKKEGNEGIIRFDIRNRVFREIALENKETRKELEDDYDRYCKGDIIVKTCIGKKWAPKLDYDYDDSLYANYIYWKTNSIFQKKCFIENSQDSKGKEI